MTFFVPLIYTSNQELIDRQLKQASDVVNAQTSQLQAVASRHASQATNITKQYMGDYSAKAQQMLRGRSTSPEAITKPAKTVKESDFPTAPTEALKKPAPAVPEKEPLIAS
jgi:hypothetical protein